MVYCVPTLSSLIVFLLLGTCFFVNAAKEWDRRKCIDNFNDFEKKVVQCSSLTPFMQSTPLFDVHVHTHLSFSLPLLHYSICLKDHLLDCLLLSALVHH